MHYVERFIEKEFYNWKQNWEGYGLEVTGCRQVGKTTTVLHFANENYKNVVYVNVGTDDMSLLETINEHNALVVIQQYCNQCGIHYEDNRNTVLVLDEVQESRAIYEKIRVFNRCLKCDLIVTGGNLSKTIEFFQPAGDLIQCRMYPLSFEEYLHYYNAYEYYSKTSIKTICDEKYDWFKQVYDVYSVVGGYPAVFCTYLEGKPLQPIFESLLNTFKSEFRINTVNSADYDKIDSMFKVICELLCKEKKGDARVLATASKLTTQDKSKRVSAAECNNLLAWLQASGIISYCGKIDLRTGDEYTAERFYFEDVGLFRFVCEKYNLETTAVVGAVAETFVYNELRFNNFQKRFYQDRPSFAICDDYELDFYVVARFDGKKYGIEVKNGKNTGKSLQNVLDRLDCAIYARVDSGTGESGKVYTIPVFLLNKFWMDKEVEFKPLKQLKGFE